MALTEGPGNALAEVDGLMRAAREGERQEIKIRAIRVSS
jgi:hypothetical protein